MLRDFARWVASIFSHWKSGLSGGGGILMSLYTAFVEQPLSAQIVLIAGAAACLLFAFFVSWREMYLKVRTDEEKERIRAALCAFIDEAHTLQELCATATEEEIERVGLELVVRVEAYLTVHLGQSYITRFRIDVGHPAVYGGKGSGPRQRHWWGVLRIRMENLLTFVGELSVR